MKQHNSDFSGLHASILFGIAFVCVVLALLIGNAPREQPNNPIDVGKATENGAEHVGRGLFRGAVRGIREGFKGDE